MKASGNHESGKLSKPSQTSVLLPSPSPDRHQKQRKNKNLLRGRFKRARLAEVEAFSASLPFDRRLYRHDIRGSAVHARMLARVGLLTSSEAEAIEAGLKEIEREIESGRLRFDFADED